MFYLALMTTMSEYVSQKYIYMIMKRVYYCGILVSQIDGYYYCSEFNAH